MPNPAFTTPISKQQTTAKQPQRAQQDGFIRFIIAPSNRTRFYLSGPTPRIQSVVFEWNYLFKLPKVEWETFLEFVSFIVPQLEFIVLI